MEITSKKQDGIQIVCLKGNLDAPARSDLRAIQSLRNCDTDLVLVLRDVAVVDSAGLSALVQIIRGFREAGCRLVLAEVPAYLISVLNMTSIDRIVSIASTTQDAIATLTESSPE